MCQYGKCWLPQTSIERLCNYSEQLNLLTIVTKYSILDACESLGYTSAIYRNSCRRKEAQRIKCSVIIELSRVVNIKSGFKDSFFKII